MSDGSQMTVDRKVVVPATREQLTSRLRGAMTCRQWTSRGCCLACDRAWQQGHEYRQIRVASCFRLHVSGRALGEQVGKQQRILLIMRFELVEVMRRAKCIEILAVFLVATPMQRLTLKMTIASIGRR